MTRRFLTALFGLGWLSMIGAGEWLLLKHELSPGIPAEPEGCWPTKTTLTRKPDVFNLIVFAHPRCPCTRATIAELALIKAKCGKSLAVCAVFFQPEQVTQEWNDSDLWQSASSIPEVNVVLDEGGAQSSNFGARTSGQVFLYDPQGRLRFQGGITASRGHSGDNVGSNAIVNIVHHRESANSETFVFGCSLQDPSVSILAGSSSKD